MYFPYLRGRQFELIALRELIERKLIGNHVIPVIEPIKPTPTLRLTLNKFSELGREIAVVRNPQVGNFITEYKELSADDELVKSILDNCVIQTYIMNGNSNAEITELLETGVTLDNLAVVNTNPDSRLIYNSLFSEAVPRYVLIPDNTTFRRGIMANRVLFEDRFVSEERNSDYKDRDIFFSEDHKFFKEEQYVGFSDYSIAGESFNEGGFAPYAVAIHIVYFGEDDILKVKSFVSDSNDDIRDPANKYYEALEYLVACPKIMGLKTYALEEFRKHHKEGTYPGLGTVKKLAIMHHLELMSNYMNVKYGL